MGGLHFNPQLYILHILCPKTEKLSSVTDGIFAADKADCPDFTTSSMPPSTSSFLELKAHLAKQEAEYKRKKASGQETYIKGGVQRPDKVGILFQERSCSSIHLTS